MKHTNIIKITNYIIVCVYILATIIQTMTIESDNKVQHKLIIIFDLPKKIIILI